MWKLLKGLMSGRHVEPGSTDVIPNWVAGPSNLIALAILFALRVRAEEKMMMDEFGDEYAAYTARTKRLVPGVW